MHRALKEVAFSFFVSVLGIAPLTAQAGGDLPQVVRIEASPASLLVTAGQSVPLELTAFDAEGNSVNAPLRIAAPRSAISFSDGQVTGIIAGEFELTVLAVTAQGTPAQVTVPVTVRWPALARVDVVAEEGRLYHGTTIRHAVHAFHEDGTERPSPAVEWSTSDSSILTVDRFGHVTAVRTGAATISATVDGVVGRVDYDVAGFPAVALEIRGGEELVRTGDVQTFEVMARDEAGRMVDDLPVTWTYLYEPPDSIVAPPGTALQEGGRIVTDVPGVYTVVASAGPLSARKSFETLKRDVVRRVEVVGQGRQQRVFTSDLWVFEGVDGRDYAFTGTNQWDGEAFVWDVTDPSNIVKTDSLDLDARNVNDVKVAPNGRWGALSREGASDRRNGVVILDLADPAHPVIAAEYDEGLTGGVHNMFATDTHLFALSNGDKYIILDMSDLSNPQYVSEYNHPDSRVHDVWVHDGLAYSAEWGTGVVVVDVGNGRWGGSIENPRLVTTFPLPSEQTHAVFPYHQESTGKFYLVVGDEIVRRDGWPWQGTGPDHRRRYDPETGRGGYPRATSGYIQFVDFTDPEDPKMVARYQVPEFGTHNMWVEDDILYQAYYEGGLRMVDISGDLMGNLYTQDREVAVFKAFDPIGYIPNAAAAWGVMTHKGHIFFADINSGLWAVRLQPRERPASD